MKASADMFTGDVYVEPITGNDHPPFAMVAHVHFAPGSRNAWHSHSAGQVVHVTRGEAIVAVKDGEAIIARTGETVHAQAGEWHFHGAMPDRVMSHLAISDAGSTAEWGALVTDDEYHTAITKAQRT